MVGTKRGEAHGPQHLLFRLVLLPSSKDGYAAIRTTMCFSLTALSDDLRTDLSGSNNSAGRSDNAGLRGLRTHPDVIGQHFLGDDINCLNHLNTA